MVCPGGEHGEFHCCKSSLWNWRGRDVDHGLVCCLIAVNVKLTRGAGAIVLSDILPLEIRGNYQSINNLAYGVGSA